MDFVEPFFEKILHMVNNKAKSVTEQLWYGFRPNMKASQDEIDRFEAFLGKLDAMPEGEKTDGYTRLRKWIQETLCDLREKKNAREISSKWLAENK